jgi:hypothetical protein
MNLRGGTDQIHEKLNTMIVDSGEIRKDYLLENTAITFAPASLISAVSVLLFNKETL